MGHGEFDRAKRMLDNNLALWCPPKNASTEAAQRRLVVGPTLRRRRDQLGRELVVGFARSRHRLDGCSNKVRGVIIDCVWDVDLRVGSLLRFC
jgi:hypothetical protein